jgi:hypothetical protein
MERKLSKTLFRRWRFLLVAAALVFYLHALSGSHHALRDTPGEIGCALCLALEGPPTDLAPTLHVPPVAWVALDPSLPLAFDARPELSAAHRRSQPRAPPALLS